MASQTTREFLDPYTTAAEHNELTPQKKIDGLNEIIKATHMCMLTTRCPTGELHSRAMSAASTEGLQFLFLANNVSYKFEELSADNHVNLGFIDTKTTNWASVSGTATVTRDQALIEKLWSPL
jgi:general stress protein 26